MDPDSLFSLMLWHEEERLGAESVALYSTPGSIGARNNWKSNLRSHTLSEVSERPAFRLERPPTEQGGPQWFHVPSDSIVHLGRSELISVNSSVRALQVSKSLSNGLRASGSMFFSRLGAS